MSYQVIKINNKSVKDIVETIKPLIHYDINPEIRQLVALKLIEQGKKILVNSNGHLIVLEFD